MEVLTNATVRIILQYISVLNLHSAEYLFCLNKAEN